MRPANDEEKLLLDEELLLFTLIRVSDQHFQNNSALDFKLTRALIPSAQDDAELVQYWLCKCQKTHQRCRGDTPGLHHARDVMPTRLINIQNLEAIYLEIVN
jgi:hypothetical protein